MRLEHMACHVCEATGGAHRYFSNPDDLRSHMREAHHACTHPDCEAAYVAFASAERLQAHRVNEHSRRLTPIDRATARALPIELPRYMPRRGGGSGSGGDAHGRAVPGAARQHAAPAAHRRGGGAREAVGLMLIDDAEGTAQGGTEPPPAFPTLAQAAGSTHGPVAGGDDAPSLPSVARVPAPPRLVRQRVACPCGRFVATVVVEEGRQPPGVACRPQCAEAQRREQLEAAFERGADAPSVFARTRDIEWPVDLVLVRTSPFCTSPLRLLCCLGSAL
jgi:hypothetical protein